MKKTAITISALLVVLSALASAAQAQVVLLSRTYVSSAGSDANTCVIAAPCLTFSGAASKTAARGEITALNSGAYGNITVTKSLTLQAAPGAQAMLGTLSSSTPVVVNANESDVVVLRNLHISRAGLGTATRGIEFNSGGALHIEHCVVAGFSDTGIYAATNGFNSDGEGPELFVKDTIARDNGTGILLRNVFASIDRSRMENNVTAGVWAEFHSSLTIRDSVMAGNDYCGLRAGTSDSSVNVEDCVATNSGVGILSEPVSYGSNVKIYVSHTMISGNNLGLVRPLDGAIYSFGNNRLANNNTNGTFTSKILEQ
jgi:hypothetical protein